MQIKFLDGTTREVEIKPYANLRGASLWNTNLQGANLRGADLWNADLQGANLYGANLRGADLRNADLDGANLRNAKLDGIKVDDVTIKSYLYIEDAKKETVLKKLLTQYKNGFVGYVKIGVHFLRGSGHDWPELAAIEKSMGKTND